MYVPRYLQCHLLIDKNYTALLLPNVNHSDVLSPILDSRVLLVRTLSGSPERTIAVHQSFSTASLLPFQFPVSGADTFIAQ